MPWTAPCSHLLPEAHPFQPQCSVYSAPFLMELQVPITGNTFLFQLFISQLKWISDSVSREGVFLGEGMKRLDMLGIWGRWRTQKRTFRPKFRFVRGVHSLLSLGSQGGMRGHDAGEMPCSPLAGNTFLPLPPNFTPPILEQSLISFDFCPSALASDLIIFCFCYLCKLRIFILLFSNSSDPNLWVPRGK